MSQSEIANGKLLISVWDYDHISKDGKVCLFFFIFFYSFWSDSSSGHSPDFMGYFLVKLETLFQHGECTRDYFLRVRMHSVVRV
jgi:hypothetical protein